MYIIIIIIIIHRGEVKQIRFCLYFSSDGCCCCFSFCHGSGEGEGGEGGGKMVINYDLQTK